MEKRRRCLCVLCLLGLCLSLSSCLLTDSAAGTSNYESPRWICGTWQSDDGQWEATFTKKGVILKFPVLGTWDSAVNGKFLSGSENGTGTQFTLINFDIADGFRYIFLRVDTLHLRVRNAKQKDDEGILLRRIR